MYRLVLVKKSVLGGGLGNGQKPQHIEVRYDLPESDPSLCVFLTTCSNKDIDEIDFALFLEVVPEVDCPNLWWQVIEK